MKIDFSQLPLANRAFSDKPMNFSEPRHKEMFGYIIELIALETSSRATRKAWQAAQLRNLLFHAAQRSPFWKRRLPAMKMPRDIPLASIPILTRTDLMSQVQAEGSLILHTDPLTSKRNSTSGSSGTPVDFFVTDMNGHYNAARSIAQHFIDDAPFTLNRLKLKSALIDAKHGFTVAKDSSWASNGLDRFLKVGRGKYIEYMHPNIPKLLEEIKRDPIGYMVAIPHLVEYLIQYVEPSELKQAGMDYWICVGGYPEPQTRKRFTDANITVQANYSSEEIGTIGNECLEVPGHYHLVSSSVIVEVDRSDQIVLDNLPMGKILVTHLHSYATPFIRYDIGDLGCLKDSCPCGYDGPVLANIYGRKKLLLKHPDGHLIPFHVRAGEITDIVKLTSYRMRQTDSKTIVVEIERPDPLTPDNVEALKAMVLTHSGPGFNVDVRHVTQIDWGKDTKRLGFKNEILT
jgi:phenylacetate-CoA ligase